MEGVPIRAIDSTDSLVRRIRREEVWVSHVAILRPGEENGD